MDIHTPGFLSVACHVSAADDAKQEGHASMALIVAELLFRLLNLHFKRTGR